MATVETERPTSPVSSETIVAGFHHVTGKPAAVEVGCVAVYRSAAHTVKQPVYLRQGHGIFLKKFIKPRRTHYGPNPPARLKYTAQNGAADDATLAKVLCHPGVAMITETISTAMSPDHELWARWRKMWSRKLSQDLEARRKQDEMLRSQRDIYCIVHPKPRSQSPQHLPMRIAETGSTSRIALYDHEDRRDPPPFILPFPPPVPLPDAVIEFHSSTHSSAMADVTVLLRRPLAPIIYRHCLGSAHPSDDDLTLYKPMRRKPVPPIEPIVQQQPTEFGSVRVTSDRVQGEFVQLGDWFPLGAERGLPGEAKFYGGSKNYPLLLRRSSKVNLARFTVRNTTRKDPYFADTILRVDALRKRVAHQEALLKEAKDTDPDLLDELELEFEDDVFNPLTYSFNKKRFARYL